MVYKNKMDINFAYTSFKWANLASHNAGVTVVVVGVASESATSKRLFQIDADGQTSIRSVENIDAYLVAGKQLIIEPITRATDERAYMIRGNMPTDGGNLLLSETEKETLERSSQEVSKFIKKFVGAQELINGISRCCIWIEDEEVAEVTNIPEIRERVERVRQMRLDSKAASTRDYAVYAHKFRQIQGICKDNCIVVTRVSSEKRDVLPVGYFDSK
jgi:hypothetical protein